MIIDIYTHIAPQAFLDELIAQGKESLKDRVNRIYNMALGRPQATDMKKRVELMDTYGIDIQLVTLFQGLDSNSTAYEDSEKLAMAKLINDNMAKVMEESGGRLLSAATVPLDLLEKGGLEEMDRAIKNLGLKAVNLPSHVNGKPLDLPEFRSFWKRAAELGIPVLIHPVNPVTKEGRSYEAEYDLTHVFGWPFETTLSLSRLVLSGIMEEYPDLKVVNHHLGGGMIPFLFGRIIESYTDEIQRKALGKVLPKPPAEYFRLFYYDTAVGGSAASIKYAYELFGADHIVFATDSPHGPNGGIDRLKTYPGLIKSLDIPEDDKKKILGGNAQKLLNL